MIRTINSLEEEKAAGGATRAHKENAKEPENKAKLEFVDIVTRAREGMEK